MTDIARASRLILPIGEHMANAAEEHVGAREDPPGSNVVPYSPTCTRRATGRAFSAQGLSWCARFVSHLAAAIGLDWHLRAAVAELAADARDRADLRLPQAAEEPSRGDVLIWGDGHGGDPLAGGPGHTGIFTGRTAGVQQSTADGQPLAVCGNDLDSVRLVELGPNFEHPTCGPLRAWIVVR